MSYSIVSAYNLYKICNEGNFSFISTSDFSRKHAPKIACTADLALIIGFLFLGLLTLINTCTSSQLIPVLPASVSYTSLLFACPTVMAICNIAMYFLKKRANSQVSLPKGYILFPKNLQSRFRIEDFCDTINSNEKLKNGLSNSIAKFYDIDMKLVDAVIYDEHGTL